MISKKKVSILSGPKIKSTGFIIDSILLKIVKLSQIKCRELRENSPKVLMRRK